MEEKTKEMEEEMDELLKTEILPLSENDRAAGLQKLQESWESSLVNWVPRAMRPTNLTLRGAFQGCEIANVPWQSDTAQKSLGS